MATYELLERVVYSLLQSINNLNGINMLKNTCLKVKKTNARPVLGAGKRLARSRAETKESVVSGRMLTALAALREPQNTHLYTIQQELNAINVSERRF